MQLSILRGLCFNFVHVRFSVFVNYIGNVIVVLTWNKEEKIQLHDRKRYEKIKSI